MKYPPNVNILRAIASGKITWLIAISEWIDNAFDRHATRIDITFEKDSITIEDNGEGTSMPHKIVQLGEHTPTPDGVGEFGMGGKECLLWAGGERSDVFITSIHHRTWRSLKVNWLDYGRSGWDLTEPDERHAEPGEIGTKIRVKPLQPSLPRDMDKLCEDLGYLYSHAIRRQQKQITITIKQRPRVVIPWEPPEFDNGIIPAIKKTINIDGREAEVLAGVVKEGIRNTRSGITYWFNSRVILPASARGCGNFNIGRICGFVELKQGWKSMFTRNKNGFTVGDEELFLEVERTILPILEAAEKAGSNFALKDLRSRLESRIGTMLNALCDTKAVRQKREKRTGPIKPVGTKRTHTRAKREQSGLTFQGTSNNHSIKIEFEPLGGYKAGEAKPPNITLNLDNAGIAELVRDKEERALLTVISGLLADYECGADETGARYFDGYEPRSFAEQLGYILNSNPALDGKLLLKAI